MKLTKSAIDKMKYQGDGVSRDIQWDSAVSGLGIRIYPTGKKAFVLSYRVNGRKRLMALGAYGVLTIQDARTAAKKHLANVESGNDPLDERKRVAQGQTVKDLCDAYMERHAKDRKKSWKDDERRIQRHIKPAWGNLKVIGIKRSDVASLHHKVGIDSPYEANRVVRLISKMLNLARTWGFTPENHTNPVHDIELYKEQKRDRWVTPDEMPALMEAIKKENNIYSRYAILMYLVTGIRKSELLRMKWSDINRSSNLIRLQVTKSGKVQYAPLTPSVSILLEAIPHIDNNPYVFVGHKEGSHLVNIDKPWKRIRKAAGLEDVRLHDLRRTTGSWLAQSGYNLPLIGKALHHENTSTTAIYAHLSPDSVHTAMEDHGNRILEYLNEAIAAETQ